MDTLTVFAGLFIVVAFIALWFLVYDEVAQQTGMKPPRLGAKARRFRRLYWIVLTAIVILLLVSFWLIG
jgi:hypothetical protein